MGRHCRSGSASTPASLCFCFPLLPFALLRFALLCFPFAFLCLAFATLGIDFLSFASPCFAFAGQFLSPPGWELPGTAIVETEHGWYRVTMMYGTATSKPQAT